MAKLFVRFLVLYTLIWTTTLFGQDPIPHQAITNEKTLIQWNAANFIGSIQAGARNIKLPISGLSDGSFQLEQNFVMDEEFQRAYPFIQTFRISQSDSEFKGTLTINQNKVWVNIQNEQMALDLIPTHDVSNQYQILTTTKAKYVCGLEEDVENLVNPDWRVLLRKSKGSNRNTLSFGSERRTYRLALICTGEFYQANGNNNADVNATIVATVNGINAIFENDLSVRFSLLTPRLFSNPNTDPFIPNGQGGVGRTIQAGQAIQNEFQSANYDIGHVFHRHQDGDDWDNGGVALLGAVCRNNSQSGAIVKAQGWSGAFENTSFSWISLATHEFGHMFGATHTFNGTGESCTDAISEITAFEIGSGTTVMSYQGICQENNNIPSSGALDLYFHVASLEQMISYINNLGSCAMTVPTQNPIPQVIAKPCAGSIVIPRGTPFYLNATGTDQNNTTLTYTWEQYDEDGAGTPTQGLIGNSASNSPIAPLFRSFPPSSRSDRYFPNLSSLVISPTNDPFQVLPNRDRTLNFRVTLRDNNFTQGAIAVDDVQVTVQSVGPLTLTAPNGGGSFNVGTNLPITWNTNGSNGLCTNASIKLSIDGGLTYPYTLATNVDYASGSTSIEIPGLIPATTQARIMVMCGDADCFTFFDISNSNFSISSPCTATSSFICPNQDLVFDRGDEDLNLNLSHVFGRAVTSNQANVSTSTLTALVGYNVNRTACQVIANNQKGISKVFRPQRSGVYNFTIDIGFNGGAGMITIFDADTYNQGSPCNSFIESSFRSTGTGGVSFSNLVSANLSACKNYIIFFYNLSSENSATTAISSITGPGDLVEVQNANPQFSHTYFAVDQAGIIRAISSDADFRSLAGGVYQIYGVTYKSSGPTPPNITDINAYLNRAFNSFYIEGDCFTNSANSFQLTVNSSCGLESITPLTDPICDPSNNSYTQSFTLTFDNSLIGSEIDFLGTSITLVQSPQIIQATGFSNGIPVNGTVSVVGDPTCNLPVTIEVPQNCCPFDLDLGMDRVICGESSTVLTPDNLNLNTYFWSFNSAILGNTPSLTATESGIYTLEATNAAGCTKTDQVMVTFSTTPVVSIDGDATVCRGRISLLEADYDESQIANVQWQFNGVTIPQETSASLPANQAGTYSIMVTNLEGCIGQADFVLSLVDGPVIDLGGDRSICEGESIILDAGDTGIFYEWRKDNVVIPGALTRFLTITESGTYQVSGVNEETCITTVSVNVTVITTPSADLGPDLSICENQNFPLTLTTNSGSIRWFRNGVEIAGQTNPVLLVNEGGTYIALVGSNPQCQVSDTIEIEGRPSPMVDLGLPQSICDGDVYIIDIGNQSNSTIRWTRDGVAIANDDLTILNVTAGGIYAVEVTNQANCTTRAQVGIQSRPRPTIEVGADIEVCEGSPATINAQSDASTLIWFRDGIAIGQTGLNFEVTQPGTYRLLAIGNTGCRSEDSLTVTNIPLPVFDLGENQVGCIGEAVTLTGPAGNFSYSWFFNAQPAGSDQQLVVTMPGSALLRLRDTSTGCEGTDVIGVSFVPGPSLSFPQDTLFLCQGSAATLTASTSASALTWQRNGNTIPGQTGTTLNITLAGTYTATAIGNNNCVVNRTIEVIEVPLPTADLGEDRTACIGENISLNAGSDLTNTYQWLLNGVVIGATNSIVLTNGGSLRLIVTNARGCSASDEIAVSFVPQPTLTLPTSVNLCEGTTVSITAQSDAQAFSWTRNAMPIAGVTGRTIDISQAGTYVCIAIGQGGCINTGSFNVVSRPNPTINLGNDAVLCDGEEIILDALNPGSTYQWSNNTTAQTLTIQNSGLNMKRTETISVLVTNTFGCTDRDTIVIGLIPRLNPMVSGFNGGVCLGDTARITASGGSFFNWSGDQTQFSANGNTATLFPTASFDLLLSVSNECDESANISLPVELFVPAEMTAGVDTCTFVGGRLRLNASGGVNYQWQNNGSFTESILVANPEIQVDETTIFIVTITDANGCSIVDSVEVCVIVDPTNSVLPVNTITPNGDGINDQLVFPGIELFPTNQLIIYNRWGNVVYEKENYQADGLFFEGKRNGDDLPADTYYYVLTFGEFMIKSSLTILRP